MTITDHIIRELGVRTTALAKDAFEKRGMAYPHPAEVSSFIGMDPALSSKYEPIINEFHIKQEESLAAREAPGRSPGRSPG